MGVKTLSSQRRYAKRQRLSEDEATALLDELDEKNPDTDAEDLNVKLKYPKSVFFIVSNEFCERFSYYGMRTILSIYLRNVLSYSDDMATIIYHVFTMFCYFFPLLGAMLADSLLGKFRTIFYLSLVYALGNVVISLASAKGALDLPARELSIVGLLLISIGTGGIKPCVSAFGGDQFVLPQQEKQLAQFFSLFYFAINSGSLVSTFLTPVLREDVKCLDQSSCYPLAFGVPAVLMVISIIIFLIGKRLYVMKKPQGNVVLDVVKCISHALVRKSKLKGEKREHWLDYADDKHDKKMINDVKAALKVLYLYLPLPFFWALFDQQGSRWTFQATRMSGELGGWSLKPDQMQVVNPLLILIFIPIFETGIYPLLSKCNLLTKPLQRLGVGGLLAAASFLISAGIEFSLEPTYAVLPAAGEAQVRIYNGNPVACSFEFDSIPFNLANMEMWEKTITGIEGQKEASLTWKCGGVEGNENLLLHSEQASTFLVADRTVTTFDKDKIEKSEEGMPIIRILYVDFDDSSVIRLVGDGHTEKYENISSTNATKYREVEPITYDVMIDNVAEKVGQVELKLGGVYSLLLMKDQGGNSTYKMNLFTITPPNSVHMLWLIPQYIVITMGEVMFSITGLEFSFTQAPVSMKSVMQAGWLLTVAFGNLIVVIIAEAKFFDSQAYEFLLFAGLMIVDMGIFALMAWGYQYVKAPEDEAETQNGDVPLQSTKEKNGFDNKNFKTDDEQ
ncbi:peptide transporter family 1 isoform X2 [Anabrus simplex]|uniref:peptide transporter family 1 isoform X2 n=1 Tax=Anabrus simplex TaxID=316456 RepID=UPI0035A3A27A